MHRELPNSRRTLAHAPQRQHASLVHALEELSSTIPTDIAYTFLPEGEDDSALLGKLVAAGLKVRSFQAARKTLEDAYLAEVAR